MENKPHLSSSRRQELLETRKALHGKRRKLHERLAEVCESFLVEDMLRQQKQAALVGELQYVLDYYKDGASWEGVE